MNPSTENCATGTLEVFRPSMNQPWDRRRVQHLHRRVGFGADVSTIEEALKNNPEMWVSRLVEVALNHQNIDTPDWADLSRDDYQNFDADSVAQIQDWRVQWSKAMEEQGLKQKWVLFWHNHFVTQVSVYECPSHLYEYFHTLEKHALGNFRDFVHDIGLTSAMMYYLNMADSTKENPNENFARELLELFTCGRDNGYTQEDIQEVARAFTGYAVPQQEYKDCRKVLFRPNEHDGSEKTIFGHTGAYDYTQVIDLIFELRAEEVALNLAGKIYTSFVNPNRNEDLIQELADYFIEVDFEIAPLIKKLFSSEHFFHEKNFGVCIKSPFELYISNKVELPISIDENFELFFYSRFIPDMGQVLFEPPNVAGWEGGGKWLNSQTINNRLTVLQFSLVVTTEDSPAMIVDFTKRLTGNSKDVEFISNSIIDYFFINGLQLQLDYIVALEVLKGDVPENYYHDGTWSMDYEGAHEQVQNLFNHLYQFPEFQLH